jgi:guanylate kinase
VNELEKTICCKMKLSAPLAPLVLCGPSGVGKGTILKALRSKFPLFTTCISHTTRLPRQGEADGFDYHFVSHEQFKGLIEQRAFIEHAFVHGNFYGTSRQELEKAQASGRICVLEIDVQGAVQIKNSQLSPSPKFLFVAPPSLSFLENRIRGRGTETEDKIQLRMQNAIEELNFAEQEKALFDLRLVHEDIEFTLPKLLSVLSEWYPSVISKP